MTGPAHPIDIFLHTESIPHVWCTGCGIGIVLNVFVQTVKETNLSPDDVYVVSGLGCTGKVDHYLKCKTLNISDDNIIRRAVHLKSDHPDKKVVVFLNDADFIAFGIDDLLQACRKDVEILLLYINNLLCSSLTENNRLTTLFTENSLRNDFRGPVNIPHLAKSCGAQYIARWTPLHPRRLMYSIKECFSIQGLSLIEVITPCLMAYVHNGKMNQNLDRMSLYHDNAIIKDGEPTENVDIKNKNEIILGAFLGNRL